LLKKIVEEAKKFLETTNIEEKADIAEILIAIDETYEFSQSDIENFRIEKLYIWGVVFRKNYFLKKLQSSFLTVDCRFVLLSYRFKVIDI